MLGYKPPHAHQDSVWGLWSDQERNVVSWSEVAGFGTPKAAGKKTLGILYRVPKIIIGILYILKER